MICIGYENQYKPDIVNEYRTKNNITKTFVLYPARLPRSVYLDAEYITYKDSIEYAYFYRLLQEIDNDTLLIIDECLRTQNRYDLTYNCFRHFLAQTKHQIVFQRLPQIDTKDDFMILFDFDTQSRWKQRKFDINLVLDNSVVLVNPLRIEFNAIDVPTSGTTKKKYEKERRRRFEKIGARDPDTIPRNLYLIGGNDKKAFIESRTGQQLSLFDNVEKTDTIYIARNQRLGNDSIYSYNSFEQTGKEIVLVEFPHRFIDFADFVTVANKYSFDVLRSALKVDMWYWNRYQDWSKRVNETVTSLSQG